MLNILQKTTQNLLLINSLALVIIGCGSGSSNTAEISTPLPIAPTSPDSNVSELIKVNQLGYLPTGEKKASIPNIPSTTFSIINSQTNNVVFNGTLTTSLTWDVANDKQFKQADFSELTSIGEYIIPIDGVDDSYKFSINKDVYTDLHNAAIKSFYYNRSSLGIDNLYTEKWSRAIGHRDDNVLIHESAASKTRAKNSIIEVSKGWYDAGDYGKYVVNSGISTYTLLAAYAHHSSFYANKALGIPESTDNIPDILNEIKWNLDWLSKMQDDSGFVYHKLTTLDWPGKEMPADDSRERYVIGKSTASALNFAATLAMASRIYKPFDTELAGEPSQWLTQAKNAWNWAKDNPNVAYTQPSDVSSGEYGDSSFIDEFSWAAAELYLTTGEKEYLTEFLTYSSSLSVPSWNNVSALGFISLLHEGKNSLAPSDFQKISEKVVTLANIIEEQHRNSNYSVAMTNSDFIWGSNSVALNKAVILMQAYKISSEERYKNASLGLVSYVLGNNPTGYSFVTGYGHNTPQFPHHRISAADQVIEPIPGMIVGGPQPGQQDNCTYPSDKPALSYLDHWCSFSTNEVAINWNAPLVYVLASLIAE